MKFGEIALAAMLSLIAASAHADDVVNVGSAQCLGSRSDTKTDTLLQLECTGAFTLTDVNIVSDKNVVIYGHESVVLHGNVKVTSPLLEVRTDGLMDLSDAYIWASASVAMNSAGAAGQALPAIGDSTGLVVSSQTGQDRPSAGTLAISPGASLMVNGSALTALDGRLAGGAVVLNNGGALTVSSAASSPVVDAPSISSASTPSPSLTPSPGGGGAMAWRELALLGLVVLGALKRRA